MADDYQAWAADDEAPDADVEPLDAPMSESTVAERSVLGGVLLDSDVVWAVLDELTPADFGDPALGTVMEAIVELAKAGTPIDPITVWDHIERTGRANARVTMPLLHELTAEVPTAANAGYYAGIVADRAARRRLAGVAESIGSLQSAPGDAAGLIESARALLDDVATRTARAPHKIGDRVRLEALVDALDDKTARRAHPTPWPSLDRIIGGLRPGALYVIAARPGVGKTVMGLQIARHLATHGDVGFVSLEMPEAELLKRLVASTGSVSMSALENQQLTDHDWKSFALAAPAIEALDLYVRDDLATPMQIVSFARTMHRGGRMRALVVDYLQLLTADERVESREAELSAMTRAFKKLAIALDIPVVLLSQLNRAGAMRRGKGSDRPQLTDLRGSGAIEQDADVVMLLHREKPKDAVLAVEVAKNRQGPDGSFELLWQGQHARAIHKEWTHTALLDYPEAPNGE